MAKGFAISIVFSSSGITYEQYAKFEHQKQKQENFNTPFYLSTGEVISCMHNVI